MEKQKYPRINSWCGWDPVQEIWVGRHHDPDYFDTFKRHKIEPVICNLRHRWFWDGGLNCNTLDIRRKGKKERYLNY